VDSLLNSLSGATSGAASAAVGAANAFGAGVPGLVAPMGGGGGGVPGLSIPTGGSGGSGRSGSGHRGTVATGPPAGLSPIEKQIWTAARALGFNNVAIAGLIGNAYQESSLNPSLNESGGRGLFSWDPSSNPQAAQVQLGNVAQQLGLVVQAIGGGGVGALNSQSSAANAAVWFEQNFERAGIPDMSNRINAANQAFSAMGGASGGSTSAVHPVTIKQLLYANPFGGPVNPERIDQGQDFSMAPGTPIKAIGAGVVQGIMGGWYKGQPYLAYKLTQGPNAGKTVYLAEQIVPDVHAGQQVAAGQTIATYASSGTGIEMGFANPNNWQQTLAQATTGYTEGEVTPAGQAFSQFLKQIGANGIYTTTTGGVTTQPSGLSAAQLLANAIQKYDDALQKAGDSILKSMTDLTDYTKSLAGRLQKVLGIDLGATDTTQYTTPPGANLVTTTGQAYAVTGMGTSALHFTPHGNAPHPTFASELTNVWHGLEGLGPNASTYVGGVNPGNNLVTTTGQVYSVSGMGTSGLHFGFQGNAGTKVGTTDEYGIPTEAAFTNQAVPILQRAEKSGQMNALIEQLKASNDKALQSLATQIVAEHKKALLTLAQELYAEQLRKDSEDLNKQTTHLKNMTTLQQHLDEALLNVATAQAAQQHDAAQAAVTLTGLQTTLAHDQATAVITQTDNQTAITRDAYATMVQAVQDATQAMADSSASIVTGIQDQTAIKVDILGERGLYGLSLIAQKLQVAYDQDKSYWDQQINLAKATVDQVTTTAHAATAEAQMNVDQVTLQQDQLVALSQQALDTTNIQEAILVGNAQQQYDATNIADQVKIAAAQQQADNFELLGDTNQQLAQIAYDLAANAPQAQQDMAQQALNYWTSYNAYGQALEAKHLQDVTDAAKADMQAAATTYQAVQDQAQAAIAASTQKYQGVQDAASQAIANANSNLAQVTGKANEAIAQAQQGLQGVTDQANQTLASDQASIDVMRETASTQYAGSGLEVNIYGLPTTDAQAIASELSWVLRTHVPT